MTAKLITVECTLGVDVATHVASISNALIAQGIDVLVAKDPCLATLNQALGDLLPSKHIHPETEVLLMFASRREHLAQVIEPALRRGTWVICERCTDYTYAHQRVGCDITQAKFEVLQLLVCAKHSPDLTLLFDRPVESLPTTIVATNGLAFHQRARAAYLTRARMDHARIKIIDATMTDQLIAASAWRFVSRLLNAARAKSPVAV